MESTNCPSDSGYELLVSGRVFRSIDQPSVAAGCFPTWFFGDKSTILSLHPNGKKGKNARTWKKNMFQVPALLKLLRGMGGS